MDIARGRLKGLFMIRLQYFLGSIQDAYFLLRLCLLSLGLGIFLSKRNKKGLVGEICKTGETSRVLFHVFVSIYRLCHSQRV